MVLNRFVWRTEMQTARREGREWLIFALFVWLRLYTLTSRTLLKKDVKL